MYSLEFTVRSGMVNLDRENSSGKAGKIGRFLITLLQTMEEDTRPSVHAAPVSNYLNWVTNVIIRKQLTKQLASATYILVINSKLNGRRFCWWPEVQWFGIWWIDNIARAFHLPNSLNVTEVFFFVTSQSCSYRCNNLTIYSATDCYPVIQLIITNETILQTIDSYIYCTDSYDIIYRYLANQNHLFY